MRKFFTLLTFLLFYCHFAKSQCYTSASFTSATHTLVSGSGAGTSSNPYTPGSVVEFCVEMNFVWTQTGNNWFHGVGINLPVSGSGSCGLTSLTGQSFTISNSGIDCSQAANNRQNAQNGPCPCLSTNTTNNPTNCFDYDGNTFGSCTAVGNTLFCQSMNPNTTLSNGTVFQNPMAGTQGDPSLGYYFDSDGDNNPDNNFGYQVGWCCSNNCNNCTTLGARTTFTVNMCFRATVSGTPCNNLVMPSFQILSDGQAGNWNSTSCGTVANSTVSPSAWNGVSGNNIYLLPVVLSEISVVNKGDYNDILWKAESEVNFSHYTIERSLDGINFKSIGKVLPNERDKSYSFADNDVKAYENRTVFYRLKMEDLDGRYDYSNIVKISGTKSTQISDSKVYPNPSTDKIHLIINSSLEYKDIEVEIFDMLGRNVLNTKFDISEGQNIKTLDIEKISSGAYKVKISMEDRIKNLTFYKL